MNGLAIHLFSMSGNISEGLDIVLFGKVEREESLKK